MPRAGGPFIYVEDDGWTERMLVQRIWGLCMLLVLVVTLAHRPYLEESIYSFAERVNMDRLREAKGSDGPLAQKAARREGGSEGRSLQYCRMELTRRSGA